MAREVLRPVEYTITEKVKAKKGKKKSTKKTVRKSGYFHLWATASGKKGKEEIYALIEKPKSGKLVEVSYKDIRFLNEEENLMNVINAAYEEGIAEAALTLSEPETHEAAVEETPAEVASEVTPEDQAVPEKPKTARRPRAAKKNN